ncbi:MAG TPA: hypothetical protein PKC29_13545 [Thermodesulfobacteriota bacterium]|nr:hypothetical protein [Thermodesulfobacteriota bacterium]
MCSIEYALYGKAIIKLKAKAINRYLKGLMPPPLNCAIALDYIITVIFLNEFNAVLPE